MSEINNIQEELKELSPYVFETINQKMYGFSVPSGYFDSLTDRIIENVNKEMSVDEELETLSPLVSDLLQKAEGGFRKPNLDMEQLLAKAQEGNDSPPQAKVRKLGFSRIMTVAASIMLFVVAGFWMMNHDAEVVENNPMARFASFEEEDVLKYLDENIDEFALDDLYESGLVAEADLGYAAWDDLTEDEAYSVLEMSLEDDAEYDEL